VGEQLLGDARRQDADQQLLRSPLLVGQRLLGIPQGDDLASQLQLSDGLPGEATEGFDEFAAAKAKLISG